MSSLRPFVRSTVNRMNAVRGQCRNSSYGHHGPPADYVPPSMNELPTPQGSWQAKHDARQRKYNATLLAGVVSLLELSFL
ncbi:uncharacterized protein LOC113368082 [Ctenocephalides felis]|uniref:uncharacterized protein LOC113368082 n=1 Tax=Ctenocephalides felis TaxID=7515 RepID=UPI000E6E1361|nr:uncharacterized protein LOC113368082 [Ctenocephalides felis]